MSTAPAMLSARRDWRLFWAAAAVLTVVVLLPLIGYEYPGMPDYLNHLARAQLIVDAELYGKQNPYYEVRHVLVANMALDALVPALVWLGLGTNAALRIFAAISLLLPIAGVIALGAVAQRRAPWIALFAFALGYTRYYVFGFLNYFFGLGLALLGYALYLHWHRQRPTGLDWRQAGTVLVFGGISLTAHLMGFGIFGLLVASVEVAALVAAVRTLGVVAGVRQRALALVPTLVGFAGCVVFYALAFEHGLSTVPVWHDNLGTKVRGSVSPFMGYAPPLGIAVAVVLVGTVAALAWRRQARLAAGWLAPIALLTASYIVLPSDTMGSYYLAARLAVMCWLLLFGFIALTAAASPRVKALVVAVALLATAAKSAEVAWTWRSSSDRVAEMRRAIDAQIPVGAKVATVVYIEQTSLTTLVPDHHVAAFAVTDRQGYMPNIFAFPLNGEAVAFKPQVIALTRVEKPIQLYTPSMPVPWKRLCGSFDAMIVINHRTEAPGAPPCGTSAFQGDGYAIYRVAHPSR